MGEIGLKSLDIPKDFNRYNGYQDETTAFLEEKLKNAEDKQGFLGNIWNNFKEATNLGLSKSDCKSMLEKYKAGEVSFEEAVEYIDSFETKQDNMKGLMSNILTGIGSIAVTVGTCGVGGIGIPLALKFGAPAGAAFKTGINLIDRATNNVKDDEFDVKTMAKDAISGAVAGTTSAVSSGVGKGIEDGVFRTSVRNGIKCGAACGAASGASSYLLDTTFDKDKKFKFGELAKNTATSALISGTVGGVVGSGMYGMAKLAGKVGEKTARTTAQAIVNDSSTSSARKILGQAERNIIAA